MAAKTISNGAIKGSRQREKWLDGGASFKVPVVATQTEEAGQPRKTSFTAFRRLGWGSEDRLDTRSATPDTSDMTDPETPHTSTDVQVMFFDTDCAGVVHNIAYLRFIEVARTLLAEQLGMALVGMAERGTYPVVVRTEIDYKRPAKLGDRLVIEGRLESVDRLRFWVSFDVKRYSDNVILAQSRQMLCVIQMPRGRPVPLPSDWLSRFAHLRR